MSTPVSNYCLLLVFDLKNNDFIVYDESQIKQAAQALVDRAISMIQNGKFTEAFDNLILYRIEKGKSFIDRECKKKNITDAGELKEHYPELMKVFKEYLAKQSNN